jgi:hypothetical protein
VANGKGSGRRPAARPDAEVQAEWDRIFAPRPPEGPARPWVTRDLLRPALPPPIAPEAEKR